MRRRILTALTHVASQLVYRWLAPPAGDGNNGAAKRPEEMRAEDWLDVIEGCREIEPNPLPWLVDYLRLSDPLGIQLATAAARHFAGLVAAGAHYLTIDDPIYPDALRHLSDPPLALSISGDLTLLQRPAISVVGSRKASGFAVHESFALGKGLAIGHALVVSGGAFGCDIAAHHGVLAATGEPAPAACVFAGGLDCLYPRANEAVFRRLRTRRALLISERLWYAPCRPLDFSARNRIIAGLSRMTIVMQAAQRSGALVTARLALEQGRDVAVLRHPPGDIRALGSEALLMDGAWGFSGAGHFLDSIDLSTSSVILRQEI